MGFSDPVSADLAPGSVQTLHLADSAVTQPKVATPIYSSGFYLAGSVYDLSTADATFAPARVYRDVSGYVWCEGAVKTSLQYASPVNPVQLPVGYRPAKSHAFITWCDQVGVWIVKSDGICTLYPANGTWFVGNVAYLSAIQFYAP